MQFLVSWAVLPSVLLCLLASFGCDGPFPTSTKVDAPDDHTENQGGAFHKAGLEEPETEQAGCSSSDCHQSDLRGGLALVDGVQFVTPSCYQCHGEKWDDDRPAPTALMKPSTGTDALTRVPIAVIPVRHNLDEQTRN